MKIENCLITKNFIRETVILAVGAARENPKKSKEAIADAVIETLEELPLVKQKDGTYRLGGKNEESAK